MQTCHGSSTNWTVLVHTHRDPIDLRLISLAVVSIERLLSHGESSLDGNGVLGVEGTCSQGLIDAIHGRDDGGDVWCTVAREKKGSVLENL